MINHNRFKDLIVIPSAIFQIKELMYMTRNKPKKHMSNIVSNFLVLKIFNIQTRECRVISFMEVIWQVSSANWHKVNIDSTAKGCPCLASCVAIFKGSWDEHLGSF